MYLYKTTTFPHQSLKSISKVAVLHRFYYNAVEGIEFGKKLDNISLRYKSNCSQLSCWFADRIILLVCSEVPYKYLKTTTTTKKKTLLGLYRTSLLLNNQGVPSWSFFVEVYEKLFITYIYRQIEEYIFYISNFFVCVCKVKILHLQSNETVVTNHL